MRQGWFWEAMRAYQEDKESDRRHVGELIRGATLRLFNLQVRAQDRLREPSKFWPMPWDERTEDVNAEEIRKLASMTDEERTQNAMNFMDRIGWKVEDGNSEES